MSRNQNNHWPSLGEKAGAGWNGFLVTWCWWKSRPAFLWGTKVSGEWCPGPLCYVVIISLLTTEQWPPCGHYPPWPGHNCPQWPVYRDTITRQAQWTIDDTLQHQSLIIIRVNVCTWNWWCYVEGGIVEMEFLENQSRRKTQSDFDRVVKLATPRIQNSFLWIFQEVLRSLKHKSGQFFITVTASHIPQSSGLINSVSVTNVGLGPGWRHNGANDHRSHPEGCHHHILSP